jgi:predicted SAM-dependent methyltransferase
MENNGDEGSMEIPANGLRLNLGCGRTPIDGWFNIDIQSNPMAKRPPDMLSDVKKIDLPDHCAVEVQAIHLWEHFFYWECDVVAKEWARLLRPGGRLSLEMPDLMKFCRNIIEGREGKKHPDQMGLWGAYGDPRDKDPFMTHRWGWTFNSLKPFLAERGFVDIIETVPQHHRVGALARDFRIEARRA